MAIARVTKAIEKYTSEYSPFAPYIAERIAVGARFKPITIMTEPITTGGSALSSHFVPATFTSAATTA